MSLEDETNPPPTVRSLGGGRYETIDCPTGRCPRVNVAELPFERQVDESDNDYAGRLERRSSITTSIGNDDELYALFGALQTDIGVPEDGISVPCRDYDEWVALAFLQGVHPDAWQYAEFLDDPEHLDHDVWFGDDPYNPNTLKSFLKDKLAYGADPVYIQFTFVGPDGYLRRTKVLRDDLEAAPQSPIEDNSGSNLRTLFKRLAGGMGLTVAGLADVKPRIQQANLTTTEPPMALGPLLLWEFESEDPPSEADHGENIVVAQNGPINGLVTGGRVRGPLRQPTRRPKTSVGASNAVPRATTKIGGARPPRLKGALPQWLHVRFQRGRRNEARALQDQGFTKNNRTVEGRDKNGNVVRTVPDAITNTQVVEVKDVKILTNTRQIQAQRHFAENSSPPRQYIIYTGPEGSTRLSGTMQGLVASGKITLIPLPFLGQGD